MISIARSMTPRRTIVTYIVQEPLRKVQLNPTQLLFLSPIGKFRRIKLDQPKAGTSGKTSDPLFLHNGT
jgi:hypothetical protein